MFAVIVRIASRASDLTEADLLAAMTWVWRVMCALYAAIERVFACAAVGAFADFETTADFETVFDALADFFMVVNSWVI